MSKLWLVLALVFNTITLTTNPIKEGLILATVFCYGIASLIHKLDKNENE